MLVNTGCELYEKCRNKLSQLDSSEENTQNRNFLRKSEELQDCDFVDILFHPVEFNDWKSAVIGAVGKLFGYPTKWVHTSLRISMAMPVTDRHEVMHDYTDQGVISYTEPIHKTTGIVRLVVPPTENGVSWLDDVLERIDERHSNEPPLDWWQAVPILRRQEPDKLVCTTFIQNVLGIHLSTQEYRCPVRLFEEFKENRDDLCTVSFIDDILFWED